MRRNKVKAPKLIVLDGLIMEFTGENGADFMAWLEAHDADVRKHALASARELWSLCEKDNYSDETMGLWLRFGAVLQHSGG